jgi:hypothetical protein
MLTRVCGGYVVAALRWELDTADAESAAGAVAALTADGRQRDPSGNDVPQRPVHKSVYRTSC